MKYFIHVTSLSWIMKKNLSPHQFFPRYELHSWIGNFQFFLVDFSYIEKFPIHVQANFDYLEWSDRKNNITHRSGIDFYTGYRSVEILWGFTELKSTKCWSGVISLFAATGIRALRNSVFFFEGNLWRTISRRPVIGLYSDFFYIIFMDSAIDWAGFQSSSTSGTKTTGPAHFFGTFFSTISRNIAST